MKKLLVVYALEAEKITLCIKDAEVVEVITGIGKTQAAASLAFAIAEHQPDAVLNIGTVGSYRHSVGDILVSRRFVDRDMQRLPIDGVCKELDMSDLSWGAELPSVIDGQTTSVAVRINTGDNFVFAPEEDLGCDAVDMESFAMAWACRRAGVPFLSVKYITDKLGENSVEAWAAKLEHARAALQAYFERYL